jgi:hypothetical protein
MRTADTHSLALHRRDSVQPTTLREKQSITTTRNSVVRQESWKLVMSTCQLWHGPEGIIFSTRLGRNGRCHIFRPAQTLFRMTR